MSDTDGVSFGAPRHLAGGGDPGIVTTHLRGHGWRELSEPGCLRTDLESPDEAPDTDPFQVLHDAGWTRPFANKPQQEAATGQTRHRGPTARRGRHRLVRTLRHPRNTPVVRRAQPSHPAARRHLVRHSTGRDPADSSHARLHPRSGSQIPGPHPVTAHPAAALPARPHRPQPPVPGSRLPTTPAPLELRPAQSHHPQHRRLRPRLPRPARRPRDRRPLVQSRLAVRQPHRPGNPLRPLGAVPTG